MSPKLNLHILNIYAPHIGYDELEVKSFYSHLGQVYREHKRKRGLLFVMGDFNAHIGKKQSNSEQFCGNFGIGKRNRNGMIMEQFVTENGLYTASTHFKHPARHCTTWKGNTRDNKPLYTQLDYICCPRRQMPLIRDCRAYNGTTTNTDHKLLVCRLHLDEMSRMNQQNLMNKTRAYQRIMRDNVTLQENFSVRVTQQVETLTHAAAMESTFDPATTHLTWNNIRSIYQKCCKKVVPKTKGIRSTSGFQQDQRLQQLTTVQLHLRQLIYNIPANSNLVPYRTQFKQLRSKVQHTIRKRLLELTNQRLDTLAAAIEDSKEDSRLYFEATKRLFGTKYKQFTLQDNEGNTLTNPKVMLPLLHDHFSTIFKDPFAIQQPTPTTASTTTSTTSSATHSPHAPLRTPVTSEEVERAITKLKSGRATDSDLLFGELFKWTHQCSAPLIAALINQLFSCDKAGITSLGEGILIPLNKPKKPHTLVNVRPTVIVTVLRKIFSTVVLHRLMPFAEQFLSPNQSGFPSWTWYSRHNLDLPIPSSHDSKIPVIYCGNTGY